VYKANRRSQSSGCTSPALKRGGVNRCEQPAIEQVHANTDKPGAVTVWGIVNLFGIKSPGCGE
jgi:hypothetical protein